MKWIAVVTILCGMLFGTVARAQGPDEQYIQIYSLIMQADDLLRLGQTTMAKDQYDQAQASLTNLTLSFPGWNEKLIQFRLKYVKEKLAQITPEQPVAPPVQTPAQPALEVEGQKTPAAITPAVTTASADEMRSLQQELQRAHADKARLEAKLREALSAQPPSTNVQELARAEEKIQQLQQENQLLKTSLQQLEAKQSKAAETPIEPPAKTEPAAESQTAKADAKKIKQLEDENAELNKKLQEAKKTAKTESAAESQTAKADARKFKQLEDQNADLNKKLQQANQDLAKWQAKDKGKAMTEVTRELAAAKARLEVLEARKVPYTPEELALMKAPTTLSPLTNAPPKKVARDLPAGTGPLVAEARRAFAAGRYEEAEQKYQQVLKQDPNSTFSLGNLAAIQMEQNRLEPAESNLSKALEIEPDDAFNVALMGILKFRQNNFDDAYAILSRAVQLDPQNPEALNYLGITLSQKGQREAAEASLRKAIQISPKYAGAHHNLAVIYATQKPAFFELARYHYQKALDNGQERNPELEKLLTK